MSVASRSIGESEEVAGHLAGCFDALYAGLGTTAPHVSDDACVVAFFECARTMGEVRDTFVDLLAHRGDVDPASALSDTPVITRAFNEALALDHSGALTAYLVTMVVGPRLLISLRDVAEGAAAICEGPLRQRARDAAGRLLESMRRIGELARHLAPQDEEGFRASATTLDGLFRQAGHGESFGVRHIG